MKRIAVAIAGTVLAAACASSTSPTPPPVTVDPPKISCPASQTIQLTSGTSTVVTFPSPTFVNGKPPVSTGCTIQSGTVLGIGTTTVSCTATDVLQRADACAFTVTVLAPPTLTVTRFVAFGDSITAGEDGVDGGPDTGGLCQPIFTSSAGIHQRVILPDSQTYPGQLQTKLAARYTTQSPTVVKQGCPGEAVGGVNTQKTRQRFDTIVSSGLYDVVLIMEGSNDLESPTSSDPVGTAAVALRLLVGDAKSVGIRPLLATIPPMSAAGRRGGGAPLVPLLNERIFEIGGAENMTIVDVYGAFNGNLSLLGDDGLHPNASGYGVIADAFFAAIKNAFEVKAPSPVLSFRRR